MLKICDNNVKLDNWNITKYGYNESSYNPDNVDMVPFEELCSTYTRVCAQITSASNKIGSIGKVTNANGVKNVDLGSLKGQCLCNLSSEVDSLLGNFGNFVNVVGERTSDNERLFLPNNGKGVDDIASFLRDYSAENYLTIIENDGTNVFSALDMYEYGNALTESTDANHSFFNGRVTNDDGTITDEYREYVASRFMNSDGSCKFDNVEMTSDIKINSNGNVQVSFKATDGTEFTINCNLTNPNALDNAYVSLPGTGGGGTYGSMSYSEFINSTQYQSTNKFISAVVQGTSAHDVANEAISKIFAELTRSYDDKGGFVDVNLNKTAVSAASASESLVLDTVQALMHQSNSVDIMLLDAVMPGCDTNETVTKMLLGSNLKDTKIRSGKVIVDGYWKGKDYSDVLEYMQSTDSAVYSYVSYRGSNPAYADSWLQQLANNGVNTVLCVNRNYTGHPDPEYQIFAGELDRVFSDFESTGNNSDGFINVAYVETNDSNPYVEVHGDSLSSVETQRILENYNDNSYYVYYPNESGAYSGNPSSLRDVADLFNHRNDSNDSNNEDMVNL